MYNALRWIMTSYCTRLIGDKSTSILLSKLWGSSPTPIPTNMHMFCFSTCSPLAMLCTCFWQLILWQVWFVFMLQNTLLATNQITVLCV